VIARSITEKERDDAENTGQKNKAQLLAAMAKIPGASLAELAKEVGWTRVVRGTVCKLGKEKRHGRTAVRGNVGVSADHRITSLALYNFARKRGVAYLRWSAQRLLCGRGKVFTALWTRPY